MGKKKENNNDKKKHEKKAWKKKVVERGRLLGRERWPKKKTKKLYNFYAINLDNYQ